MCKEEGYGKTVQNTVIIGAQWILHFPGVAKLLWNVIAVSDAGQGAWEDEK